MMIEITSLLKSLHEIGVTFLYIENNFLLVVRMRERQSELVCNIAPF